MAEQNTNSPRKSLYMHNVVQQVSTDVGDVNTRESPISPDLPMISTFGQEFRLMCPVCLRDLNQPKQLTTCYHIFCKDCLQPFLEKAENGKVTCPLDYCKRSCPKELISKALNSDTYLHAFQGLVSVYTESGDVFCSDDSHDYAIPAAYFCLESGHNLCESCYSNQRDNEEFKHHHYMRLFKTPTTMTVGMNRISESSSLRSVDQLDLGAAYKCPICRNTDQCEHENWLKDLWNENFRRNDECLIPGHADGNKLIAYCTKCEEPICRNCSMIEHKDHETVNIGRAMKDKIPELQSIKKMLGFQQEMFHDAAKACDKAELDFKNHVLHVEQEMIGRKGSMQVQVEEAFNIAFSLIEQTGQKQSELNRQSEEMHDEDQFLKTAIQLAENALVDGIAPVEVARVWKGLSFILEGLGGEKKKMSKDPEVVIPQDIVEKRLVLPAPSCMNPDLRILRKVGVENTILRQAFILKAEDELLLFYSILPLTEMEALVSCKTQACATSVVQYSNVESKHYSVSMKDEGQYSIIAVPGNGIVATLYQAPGGCGDPKSKGKKQILFWDQALDTSMTELEAQGAGDQLKVLAETDLPPRGVAVTADNHLVVCTARDPPRGAGGRSEDCHMLVMTMRGDILRRRVLEPSSAQPSNGQYFPRYVTVNINGDICVTDEKDQSVTIFNSKLDNKHRITNPYERDEQNNRFSPRGICHDSFGRLIVADPNNNAVVRIEYSHDIRVTPQVILKDGLNKVTDLSSPTLVAMGPGPRLWVVCRSNIQVFEYMDKE